VRLTKAERKVKRFLVRAYPETARLRAERDSYQRVAENKCQECKDLIEALRDIKRLPFRSDVKAGLYEATQIAHAALKKAGKL